jgi:hypothetical protein
VDWSSEVVENVAVELVVAENDRSVRKGGEGAALSLLLRRFA